MTQGSSSYPFWVRRFLGFLSRFTVPPYIGRCYRCGMAWRRNYHITDYRDGSGCFPLCEWCWVRLTPEQRLPYYMQLMDLWESEPDPSHEFPQVREQVRTAVLAGL